MKRVLPLCVGGMGVLLACGASPAMRAAADGDRPRLASVVAAREAAGDLSNGEAASLAQAVAERELRAASGPEAVERVRDVRPCAPELDGALAARSDVHDEGGAEAALARVDSQGLGFGAAREYLRDPQSRWRAVGVRGLVREDDQQERGRAMLDPDPIVRRAAVRAARDARDPVDRALLAEAARVDPEPIVRTEAVRAMAALPPAPDGGTANVLRDLWTAGDDALREDIAIAWSSPALWDAGGLEALRVIIAAGHGPGVVEAAAAVLRRPHPPEDLAASAVAQLSRAMEHGTTASRLQALAEAPAGATDLRAIVRSLADSDDAETRVAALARLVESREAGSLEKLEALAQPGSPVGERARLALASAGDRRIQAWVERDLAASDPDQRLAAAIALGDMGVAARAAPLLADGDPRVRTRAACTILAAARNHRP
jgi:hypothetical protein